MGSKREIAYCPVLSVARQAVTPCYRQRCAWWFAKAGRCSILQAAEGVILLSVQAMLRELEDE